MGTFVTNSATATAAARPRIRPIMMPVRVLPPDLAEDLRRLRAIVLTFWLVPRHQAAPDRCPTLAGSRQPAAGGQAAVRDRPPARVRRCTRRESQPRNRAARRQDGGERVPARPAPGWRGIRQGVAAVQIL